MQILELKPMSSIFKVAARHVTGITSEIALEYLQSFVFRLPSMLILIALMINICYSNYVAKKCCWNVEYSTNDTTC